MTDSGKLFQAFVIRVQNKHVYGWLALNYAQSSSRTVQEAGEQSSK